LKGYDDFIDRRTGEYFLIDRETGEKHKAVTYIGPSGSDLLTPQDIRINFSAR